MVGLGVKKIMEKKHDKNGVVLEDKLLVFTMCS